MCLSQQATQVLGEAPVSCVTGTMASLGRRQGPTAPESNDLGYGAPVDRDGVVTTFDPTKHLADRLSQVTDGYRATHTRIFVWTDVATWQ